jgi:YVTN family beta-propeller protein
MSRTVTIAALVALLALAIRGAARAESFVNFESGPVRPLGTSPSGNLLFAANTPDNRLEVFSIGPEGGLSRLGETIVGLEPVAIAVRSETEVWVVNHLSDSVSVVDTSDPTRPFVRATVLVGDEPRDIVLAGENRDRIFVTTAHRGQNLPHDPQLTTPGIGRADVWVIDAGQPNSAPTILTLFCDTPRALAVSADGRRVYAAAFHSGNRSTVLNQIVVSSGDAENQLVDDGFQGLGMPEPTRNVEGIEAPEAGLIVKYDLASRKWLDPAGRDWSARVRLDLPDRDVFTIDAAATPPALIGATSGVGTVIFNLAVHPTNGKIWATNLESRNEVRFEPAVNGHIAESRVSIIDGESVEPVHINPHIDYGTPSGPDAEIEQSLAFPVDLVFSPDGETAWVAAFGSRRVGVLDAAGNVVGRVDVGGGPCGLALLPAKERLYVLNRFDLTISIVDTSTRLQIATVPLLYNPEPEAIRIGRPLLYDARNSGHGDSACASCHIFGDFDSLAWDLGDPNGKVEANPLDRVAIQAALGPMLPFHPMKGPMTTQSLRGMKGAGAMHWRGDRNGVSSDAEDPDVYDDGQAFLHFRGAFEGLLGMDEPLPIEEMEKFRDFILTVVYPPNPIANIDGTLTATQQAGRQIFDSNGSRFGLGGDGDRCADCHTMPFGTNGRASFELEPQEFKVAHLRNLYQKVGMFGYALPSITRDPLIPEATPTPHMGEQVRGFGFLHDGSIPTLFNFFRVRFFPIAPFTFLDSPGRSGNQKVRELEAFLLTFDTGLAPVIGHQVTLTAANLEAGIARYEVLRRRADANACELAVVGTVAGAPRSYLYEGDGIFLSDRAHETVLEAQLRDAVVAGGILTATAVPVGMGTRFAIDRDEDGALDGDERDAGTDPADPTSRPGGGVAFLRANCNGDAFLNIADPVFTLNFLFQGSEDPLCRIACDANGDGRVDISDASYSLNFLFLGGPAPGTVPECETSAENCEVPVCP